MTETTDSPQQASSLLNCMKNKNFLLLWLSQAISALGDRFNQLALLSLVTLAISLGTAEAEIENWYIAMFHFFSLLPFLVIGPFAGVIVDSFNKKWIMIIADIVRAALVLLLLTINYENINYAFPLLFLIGCMTALFSPAKSAFLPTVVKKGNILASNSLLASTGIISVAVGGMIGEKIITNLGYDIGIFVDCSTYIISAFLLFAIITKDRKDQKVEVKGLTFKKAFTDIKAGFKYILSDLEVVRITGISFVFWGAVTSFYVSSKGFIRNQLIIDELQAWTTLLAVMGFGLLLGALITAKFGHLIKRATSYMLSMTGLSLSLLVFSVTIDLGTATIIGFFMGIAGGSMIARIDADLLKIIPEDIRGRVFAAKGVVFAFASLAPAPLIGYLNIKYLTSAEIIFGLSLILAGLSAIQIKRVFIDYKQNPSSTS